MPTRLRAFGLNASNDAFGSRWEDAILSHIDPRGRTSRPQFWIATAIAAAAWLVAYAVRDLTGGVISASIFVCVVLALLFVMARRLYDAGISRYWALLAFFPFSVTWDLGWLNIGFINVYFVDLGDLIRNAPFVFGLMAPTSSNVEALEAGETYALEQA